MKSARTFPPDWILVMALAIGIFLWQRTVFPLWMVDLLPIQVAAWQWEHGESEAIYSKSALDSEWQNRATAIADSVGGEGNTIPYFYAPFVAAVLSPFADLSANTWRNTLFAINVLLLFGFAYLICASANVELTARSFLWSFALVLVAHPMARATHLAQIVPLLAAGFWGAILWMRRAKPLTSGIILGITSAIKLFPIISIFISAIRGQWKSVVTCIGVVAGVYLLSIGILGWQIHQSWWTSLQSFGGEVYSYQGNQSVIGWFSRLFWDGDLISFVPRTSSSLFFIHLLLITAIGGTSAFILWRNRNHIANDTLPLFVACLISAVLLSAANAWEHYWLFCLPALAIPIRGVWNRGKLDFFTIYVCLMSFLFLMKLTRFYSDSTVGRIFSGSQTVGMLLLWLWILWRIQTLSRTEKSLSINGRS